MKKMIVKKAMDALKKQALKDQEIKKVKGGIGNTGDVGDISDIIGGCTGQTMGMMIPPTLI